VLGKKEKRKFAYMTHLPPRWFIFSCSLPSTVRHSQSSQMSVEEVHLGVNEVRYTCQRKYSILCPKLLRCGLAL
jgi:hypothetical protein